MPYPEGSIYHFMPLSFRQVMRSVRDVGPGPVSLLAAFPDRPIIAASGRAGYGRNQKIHQRRMGNLYIIGDEGGECPPGASPMAPRIGVVAHMQAN
jgi:hypothetical protein